VTCFLNFNYDEGVESMKGILRTIFVGVCLVLFASAYGCAVNRAAKQPSEKDTSLLSAGTPRAKILAEFGAPINTKTKDGKKTDVYSFTQGYSSAAKAGRVFLHGAADIMTLGLWELVGGSVEGAYNGEKVSFQVTYDEKDLAKEILPLNKEARKELPTSVQLNKKFNKERTTVFPLNKEAKKEISKSSKEISNPKTTSASLEKSLERVKSEKTAAILATKQAATKAQADILASNKRFDDLTTKSSKEISNPKTTSASLEKSLERVKSEKTAAILATKQAATKAQAIKTKDQRAIITSHLYKWVKAWENQNTNLYLSFYSKNFKDPKRSRSKWEAKRRRSLKNASNVSIEISDIRSSKLDNVITMLFTQRYKAKNISDLGEKELIWEKEGKNWKIIKETWQPS
jgi:hypothetical protein